MANLLPGTFASRSELVWKLSFLGAFTPWNFGYLLVDAIDLRRSLDCTPCFILYCNHILLVVRDCLREALF